MDLEVKKIESSKRVQLDTKMKKYNQELEEAKRKLAKLDDRKNDPEAELEDYVSLVILEER